MFLHVLKWPLSQRIGVIMTHKEDDSPGEVLKTANCSYLFTEVGLLLENHLVSQDVAA